MAVVARIVEQLGGQLRVNSKVDEGSRFSFLMPSTFAGDDQHTCSSGSSRSSLQSSCARSRNRSRSSKGSELERLVEAISTHHMHPQSLSPRSSVPDTSMPRPVKIGEDQLDTVTHSADIPNTTSPATIMPIAPSEQHSERLKILVVEVCHLPFSLVDPDPPNRIMISTASYFQSACERMVMPWWML